MERMEPPSPVWWWLIGACAVVTVALVAVVVVLAPWDDGTPTRQDLVAARGADVMPFDQNQTVHVFRSTSRGGVETVRVRPGATAGQIGLIRAHLAHEQMLFSTGDFSDPMTIHGHAMPGVRSLARSAASGALVVGYGTAPGGAWLSYQSTDPAVVDAVHAWFDAQLRDHGANATN